MAANGVFFFDSSFVAWPLDQCILTRLLCNQEDLPIISLSPPMLSHLQNGFYLSMESKEVVNLSYLCFTCRCYATNFF
ncbi:hypothetical protein CsSME_00015180 [Camellia sinensis var. sinensis]